MTKLASLGAGSYTQGDPCPAGVQDTIDTMYKECGGECDFDDQNDQMRTLVGTIGCAGATQAAPAIFVAAAAVVGHFLN